MTFQYRIPSLGLVLANHIGLAALGTMVMFSFLGLVVSDKQIENLPPLTLEDVMRMADIPYDRSDDRRSISSPGATGPKPSMERAREDSSLVDVLNSDYVNRKYKLSDIKEWKKDSKSKALFKVPSKGEVFSSEVIANDNKDPTTFVLPEVQIPQMRPSNDSGNVIARYSVIVPLFVPALKKKDKPTTRAPLKYITETVTEMVPVERIMPHVKEEIRAEPVGQSSVETGDASTILELLRNTDDELSPRDEVIGGMV